MSLLSAPLQAFLAIVQDGTVHGAARELKLTQTAVTQRIRGLEKELNVTLFLRSRKGMKLTTEGEALLRYCRSARELEGQTLSSLRKSGTEQPVRLLITGPTSCMTSRVIPQCTPLFEKWKNLLLSFQIDDEGDRVQLLRTGRCDLAVVAPGLVPNEMTSKTLKPDRYLLVASAKWKGRRLQEILAQERIIDFDESDSTTLSYLKKFDLHTGVGSPRLFANDNDAILRLFRAGVGYGTLTAEIAKPFLESGELIALNGGHASEEALALVWYPRAEAPAYLSDIVKAIK